MPSVSGTMENSTALRTTERSVDGKKIPHQLLRNGRCPRGCDYPLNLRPPRSQSLSDENRDDGRTVRPQPLARRAEVAAKYAREVGKNIFFSGKR